MKQTEKKENRTIGEHYIYIGDKEETKVKIKGMGWIVLNKNTEFIINNERALTQIKDDKRFRKKGVKDTKGGD